MCIILSENRKHVHVEGTRLFARLSGRGKQYLVYSMTVELRRDNRVAMILPLPVSERTDDAVRWVDLSRYPKLFSDIESAFQMRSVGLSLPFDDTRTRARATLKIHEVGYFIASFVPTPGDFDRLDEIFRVPPTILDRYPEYQEFGFAVFQLSRRAPSGPVSRDSKDDGGDMEIHPMAFEFSSRIPESIYFPTVHFHGDKLEDEAAFDHAFYWQGFQIKPDDHLGHCLPSAQAAAGFVDADLTGGAVDPESRIWKATQQGRFPNRDTILYRRVSEEAAPAT